MIVSRPRLFILGDDESRAFLGADPVGRFGLEVAHERLPPLALLEPRWLDRIREFAPDYVLVDLVHERGDLICGELADRTALLRLPAGLGAAGRLRVKLIRQFARDLCQVVPSEAVLVHRLLLVEPDASGASTRQHNQALRRCYQALVDGLPRARQLQPNDALRRAGKDGLDPGYRFALRERLGRILSADLAGAPPDSDQRGVAGAANLVETVGCAQVRDRFFHLADSLASVAPGRYRIPATDPLALARAHLSAGADAGDPGALRALASCLLDGRLGVSDNAAARDLQAYGAGLGDPDLARDLADALIRGDGLPRRPEDGLVWLKHAAQSGSAGAKLDLACFYLAGDLLPHRPATARALLRQAAEEGEPEGARLLADLLADAGDGGAASYWRRRAA